MRDLRPGAGGVRRGHGHGDSRLLSLDLRESCGCVSRLGAGGPRAQDRGDADSRIHDNNLSRSLEPIVNLISSQVISSPDDSYD